MTNLRILVPIKRVIDYAIKPRLNRMNTDVEKTGVKFSMNPFDDIALEEAVRIREKGVSVESIHAVSIGPLKSQDILRTALAKGADTSTLINSKDTDLEPLAIAKILKKIVERQNSNLVILGKQAIDDDCNNTGQMLAGLLNWPQATNAAKVEVNESFQEVTITREIDGGEEVLTAKLPLIITTDLRLNVPRYATLPNIMKAKKKPMEQLTLEHFQEIPTEPRLKVLKLEKPGERGAGIKLNSVDELISNLKDAKII